MPLIIHSINLFPSGFDVDPPERAAKPRLVLREQGRVQEIQQGVQEDDL